MRFHVDIIQTRQQVTNGIPTAAFVISRAKKGTTLARDVTNVIAEYGFPVLNGAIHDRTVFAKALTDGSTALDDEPNGQANWEIHHIVKQIREAFA